jgi:hypothetical protein
MCRRTVGLLLAVGLVLVTLRTWAELGQSKKLVDDFPSDVASVWFDTLYDVTGHTQACSALVQWA